MIKSTKYKICRRLGSGVFEKCQTQKFALSESKKSRKTTKRKQVSDFGLQLLEKQKVRFSYGLKERQFAKYVSDSLASKKEGNVYERLFGILETRLDNVVYRLGLAETRAKARQIVSHGHITINGKRLNIPSYKVSIGDVVGVRNGSADSALFTNLEERTKGVSIPAWLSFDAKSKSGKVVGLPKLGTGESFDLKAVFEFYSR